MDRFKDKLAPTCHVCDGAYGECTCRLKIRASRKSKAEDVVLPGDVIDMRYEIVRTIGRGGSATVFLVRHIPSGRLFAMKMLRKEVWHNEEKKRRFEREARTLSTLQHENLVSLYDYGSSTGGNPYFITDFIEGRTLSRLLKLESALPAKRACSIFAQICDAMEYAHRKGLVHRDLKPSNIILLTDASGEARIKVVDFGIAKFYTPAEGECIINLTHEGKVVGSPYYMSPEHCRGRELDPRSDIYSLGCIMYEALSGKLAFYAPYPMAIFMKQINTPAPRLRSEDSQPDIDATLEAIVMRTLAKSPDERYRSMAELKNDLLNWQQSKIKDRD